MPTSAPGSCERRAPARLAVRLSRAQRGLTLIEAMVVLLIVGITAGTLSIGIDAVRAQDTERAVERLRRVLETTANRAQVRGQPLAVEFSADGYRFFALHPDGRWVPYSDPPLLAPRRFPERLTVASITTRGGKDSPRRLVFGTSPPPFQLHLDTREGRVTLSGSPTGRVSASAPARSGT